MSRQSSSLNTFHKHKGIHNDTELDIPTLVTLDQNPNYAIWNMPLHRYVAQSAWNDDDGEDIFVRGDGFVKTKQRDGRDMVETLVLDDGGRYAAHTTWHEGNFGHFVHDHLPTIALLKAHLPSDTKFLLIDTKVSRNILMNLDEEWTTNNVVWIDKDQPVQIRNGGSLTVPVTNAVPEIMGCCRQYDFMRQWAAEKQLQMNSDSVHIREPNHEDKFVVFYRRLANKDLHHGRTLEIEHEKKIMRAIQDAMKKYGRKEKFVHFTGNWEGKTLSIFDQMIRFRRASTIIGPHGSGIGGNILWTNPFARTCEERVKYLEFMPDNDSARVQGAFAHYWSQWRKWPIDYHTIIYQPNSTADTTYISLDDLSDALEDMWGPAATAAGIDYKNWKPTPPTKQQHSEQEQEIEKEEEQEASKSDEAIVAETIIIEAENTM